jgi:hypothetical protein
MSTPNVTPNPTINPETVGDPTQQAQPQTQPSAAPAQDNTQDDSGGGGGFLSHVGHVLSNLGKPMAKYTVDDKGNTVAAQADSTPGQLFKNLLIGALNGLAAGSKLHGNSGFAGGLGAGFEAEQGKQQAQDDRARAQAQQQFKNKTAATEAADKHTLQGVQLQHFTLDNARLTHENNLSAKLEPLKLKEAEDSLQEHQLNLAKSAHDMGLTNGRDISDYTQLSEQDAKDVAAGKKVFVSKLNGSGTLYDLPSDPYQTNNTNPFEIATWGVDKNGKPVRTITGTVAAGKGTVAGQMAALNQENKTYADTWGKYVDTKAKQAQTAEAYAKAGQAAAETKKITQEVADTKDEKEVMENFNTDDFSKLNGKQRGTLATYTTKVLAATNNPSTNAEEETARVAVRVKAANLLQRLMGGQAATGGGVQMINPQGQAVSVPANRVDEVKKHGYKLANEQTSTGSADIDAANRRQYESSQTGDPRNANIAAGNTPTGTIPETAAPIN